MLLDEAYQEDAQSVKYPDADDDSEIGKTGSNHEDEREGKDEEKQGYQETV